MKKLILAAVFFIGGLTTMSAQTQAKTETTKTTTTEATPSATTTTTTATTTEYKDVALDVLPAAIKTAVTTSYPGAVINSAQVSGSEYKINLTVGDQTGVVYSDATGKWIKK